MVYYSTKAHGGFDKDVGIILCKKKAPSENGAFGLTFQISWANLSGKPEGWCGCRPRVPQSGGADRWTSR